MIYYCIIMFDEFLLRYILEFLTKCRKCNKFDIKKNGEVCCICKDFYCKDCRDKKLVNYYGYYKNRYCLDCSNYFYIS